MKRNEGICITGRTGGGKSSLIADLMRGSKDPCMWFTVKPDEAQHAKQLLPNAVLLSPGSEQFNPLAYEMGRVGGSALGLATILSDVNEVISKSNKKGEAFWETNFLVATMHAINVVWLTVGEQGTLANVYQLLMGTPETPAAVQSPTWQASACARVLTYAEKQHPNDPRVKAAVEYLKGTLPQSGEKVRGAVISQATNVLLPFTLPPLADMTSGSSITPETLSQRQTILDFNILTYGKMGQVFQLLMSFFMLEYLLRRSNPTPFIFVRDEYQFFCHPDRDIKAQTVARSQNFISIAAFQTIPVLVEGLGGDIKAKTQAQAIYACHVNKLMCNNNCQETNELNATIIGKDKQYFFGTGTNQQKLDPLDVLSIGGAPNVSMSQQYHYRVEPITFNILKTGGEENNFTVQAIHHNGFDFRLVEVKQCHGKTSRSMLSRIWGMLLR